LREPKFISLEENRLFRIAQIVSRAPPGSIPYVRLDAAARMTRAAYNAVRIPWVEGEQPPSEREVQCLEALSTGRTPKQIAEDLGISESAVRLYLHSIRRKLDCATIARAVAVAISLNIIGS